MIPLRILHAVADPAGPEGLAARASAEALREAGHTATLIAPGLDQPSCLGFRPGWWAWATGERTRTVRAVAQWMPDVLHVHGVQVLGPLLEVARRLGLGVVASLTQGEDPHAARRLRDPRIGWVVVPTEHLRAHALGRIGLARDRLALIPPLLPPMEPHQAAGSSWRLGILGLPEPGLLAALNEILEAVAEVQESGLALEAVVHTGWLGPRVRASVDPLLAQFQATAIDADLPAFLAQVDAVALASRREMPAIAVLAAQAAGLPVVAKPIGGIPELISDGWHGLLVSGHGVEAWASSLRQLHDHQRRGSMGTAAQTECQDRFRNADAIDALVALYRSALGTGGAAAKAEVSQTWRRLSDARAR